MTAPRVERAYEKHAWIIFFAFGAVSFVLGLFITLTSGSADPDLQAVGGTTWAQLSSAYPQLASYIALNNRTSGLSDLVVGFFLMAISLKSYRRGEKWSWYAFWLVPVYVGLDTAFEVSAGGVSEGQTGVIFLVLSLVGLLLPYRRFFPKNES